LKRIAFYDDDDEYLCKIVNFLREKIPDYNIYNAKENTNVKEVDILFTSNPYYKGIESNKFIHVKENIDEVRKGDISKYTDVRKLVSEIRNEGSSDGKVITFCSLTGSSGKTTLSLALAEKVGENNKVLYLNFEKFTSLNLYLKNISDNSMSLFRYYFKRDKEKAVKVIDKDFDINLDYLFGFKTIQEMEKLKNKELKDMLEFFKKMYDYIIIDLYPSVDSKVFFLKNFANVNFIVLKDNLSDYEKSKIFMKSHFLDRDRIVINKKRKNSYFSKADVFVRDYQDIVIKKGEQFKIKQIDECDKLCKIIM